MAFFTPAARCFALSRNVGSVQGKRLLFSCEILGVENFKRIRIFEKDKLVSREDFIKQLSAGSLRGSSYIAHDLTRLIYIAEKESEISLIKDMLKQLYSAKGDTMGHSDFGNPQTRVLPTEGPLSPRRFHFGPLVFRLLYILKDTASAQALFEHEDLKPLFQNTTCYLLLMDMLYEAGCYQKVIDTYGVLQKSGVSAKFTPDCTTLAMAALYQLNSAASYSEMKRLKEEAKAEGSALSRRSLLFAAALALRQGEPACALNIIQPFVASNETLFRNIKVMALAQLGHLKEVLKTVEEGMRNSGPALSRAGILYSDTVREITNHFEVAGNPELCADLEGALSALEAEGLLSPQTVEHFVNRPVLRQKKTGESQSFKSRVKSPLKVKMK